MVVNIHRRTRISLGWAGLALLAALIACTLPVRRSASLPCPLPTQYSQEGASPVSATLRNNSCTALCGVWVSHKSCDDWGVDWLDFGVEAIPSGGSYSLSLPPGKYDLNIQDCMGSESIWYGINFTRDDEWVFTTDEAPDAASCPAALTIENHSDAAICHLWITPNADLNSWGYNWLGKAQIEPGAELVVPVPSGVYDIKAEDCQFNQLDARFQVSIDGSYRWSVP